MDKLSISKKYYLTGLAVIIIMPVLLISLYEWLAGGVLNGVAGSWREAIINPDILLLFMNPLLLLGGYGLLVYFFRCYMGSKKAVVSKIFAVTIFALATVVVVLGVFWKAFTT